MANLSGVESEHPKHWVIIPALKLDEVAAKCFCCLIGTLMNGDCCFSSSSRPFCNVFAILFVECETVASFRSSEAFRVLLQYFSTVLAIHYWRRTCLVKKNFTFCSIWNAWFAPTTCQLQRSVSVCCALYIMEERIRTTEAHISPVAGLGRCFAASQARLSPPAKVTVSFTVWPLVPRSVSINPFLAYPNWEPQNGPDHAFLLPVASHGSFIVTGVASFCQDSVSGLWRNFLTLIKALRRSFKAKNVPLHVDLIVHDVWMDESSIPDKIFDLENELRPLSPIHIRCHTLGLKMYYCNL